MDEQIYKQQVMRTYNNSQDMETMLIIGAMGLAGETGEVVDSLKKMLFQGHAFNLPKLCEELGDVFWYLGILSLATGISFEEMQKANIEKLQRRYPDGFDKERSIFRE
jgi:NTP pyrophosphatase (non-canonical NTP hydrolase)